MTNDDRKDEQPRHGEQEQPRYGERVSPEQGGAPRYEDQPTQQYQQQSAPQWGQHDQQQQYGQQGGQQQYGQQGDQYGQQQYSQQPQQYGDQQQAGAPAWNAHDEPAKKKKTVGIIAFFVGVVALVLGVVAGVLLGNGLGNSQALQDYAANGGAGDPQELQRQLMQDPAAMSSLGTGVVVFGIGSLFGLWAIVQGIIAIATKRGRVWGVLAVVLALVAVVVAIALYGSAIAGSVSGM
ncbi:hypothetical protein [Curtobacterium herbarum]|uniref:DUF4064 domain-containing protein n=1 Tax=Curtobacterium herbarum TaxID=150122 RepID=A0ABN1ZBC9_9MICO|nr:hypothetical protein [Curtobacterium herbarum]MBM7474011.1 hypothetical protein [Curtobacterium herbarum]MCS6544662.1 hypothetical protein [Curtobacterium herbarum]